MTYVIQIVLEKDEPITQDEVAYVKRHVKDLRENVTRDTWLKCKCDTSALDGGQHASA